VKISGTREWAVATVNCCTGCPHNCRYCYARYDAAVREKSLSVEDWPDIIIQHRQLETEYPLYPGPVMFPSRHDIVPANLTACLVILEKLFVAGNRVLIVSKPHLECIQAICSTFQSYQEKLLFRFTITADDDRILSFWEPGAPGYRERKQCLRHAHQQGFQTSVSVEPMLDINNVARMISDLQPYVTHSIWLGKMNKIDRRVIDSSGEMQKEKERVKWEQSDQKINELYRQLREHPLIRWKESIKEVVGIQLARQPGLDM